jgi:WhiB family transcriptional regulator, redox-sensing transcriptional regulator
MAIAPGARAEPAVLTDRQLQARISSRQAHCAGGSIDPDEWFPATAELAQTAPSLASHALALCASCPVRAECLELSLRQWHGAGRYGIWGGTLERERRAIRRRWLAGISVARLLPATRPSAPGRPRPSRSSPPGPGQLAGSTRP